MRSAGITFVSPKSQRQKQEAARQKYEEFRYEKAAAAQRKYQQAYSARRAREDDAKIQYQLEEKSRKEQAALLKAQKERATNAKKLNSIYGEWITVNDKQSYAQGIANKKAALAKIIRTPIKILAPRPTIIKKTYAQRAAERKAEAIKRLKATRLRNQSIRLWKSKDKTATRAFEKHNAEIDAWNDEMMGHDVYFEDQRLR